MVLDGARCQSLSYLEDAGTPAIALLKILPVRRVAVARRACPVVGCLVVCM